MYFQKMRSAGIALAFIVRVTTQFGVMTKVHRTRGAYESLGFDVSAFSRARKSTQMFSRI